MTRNSILKYILFAITLVAFASCDRGFNEIGTDIVGGDNFAFEKYSPNVIAFNQNIGPVQTSNLPINALGIYTNPAFGTTTANYATQLEMASIPTIDINLHPVIDSIVLKVPYFSKKTGIKDDGVTGTYELDSIYGPSDSKLKLSIYESGYYMRSMDPSTQNMQLYYSNQNSLFDLNKKQLLNDNVSPSQNQAFSFSNAEYIEKITATDGTVSLARTSPAMRMNLNTSYFQNKIFGSMSIGQLANNNLFKNYFRGLYFKVENSGSSTTNMAMLNFKAGAITIYYKEDASLTDATPANKVRKTIVLNLSGNSVNLFQNDYLPSYTNGIISPNTSVGDEKLYLKGGEGSMAIINVFGTNELEQFRTKKWLINDATLTFTIDNASMSNALTSEPNRVYLYDLNNKKQLLDYTFDGSTGGTSSKYNKFVHGGIIQKGTDGKGTKYQIKLTNHIRNLIKNDTVTNVKLGLVISENINDVSNKELATPVFSGNIKRIPTSSAMSPLGTILFGTNPSIPEEKRLKFQIYYTKPN